MSRRKKKNKTVNEETIVDTKIIEEEKETEEMTEKKSVWVKIGETAGKIANSKVTKVVAGIGAAAGLVALGFAAGKSGLPDFEPIDDDYGQDDDFDDSNDEEESTNSEETEEN